MPAHGVFFFVRAVLFEVHVFAVVRQCQNERFDFVEASRRHFEDFFFCEKVFFGFFFVVGVVVAVVVVVVGFVDVSGVFFYDVCLFRVQSNVAVLIRVYVGVFLNRG